MLLSHVGYSADGRRVRGFVHARTIEGTGGVAGCPLHAASPPVPGSPAGAAAPSDMRGMIVSVALRLSDRNKRCTMVCCGGPNCSEQRSARRPRMASAVRRGSAASQRSMSARCGSSIRWHSHALFVWLVHTPMDDALLPQMHIIAEPL